MEALQYGSQLNAQDFPPEIDETIYIGTEFSLRFQPRMFSRQRIDAISPLEACVLSIGQVPTVDDSPSALFEEPTNRRN